MNYRFKLFEKEYLITNDKFGLIQIEDGSIPASQRKIALDYLDSINLEYDKTKETTRTAIAKIFRHINDIDQVIKRESAQGKINRVQVIGNLINNREDPLIEEIVQIVLMVTQNASRPITNNQFIVEDCSIPHKQPKPSELANRSAVYLFFSPNDECLKVGKVGRNNYSRFCYMHYSLDESIKSSLIRSLLKDETLSFDASPDFNRNWILANTRRINIYFENSCPDFINGLIEAALIYKYQPLYEKNSG